jgi:hypothetical protein
MLNSKKIATLSLILIVEVLLIRMPFFAESTKQVPIIQPPITIEELEKIETAGTYPISIEATDEEGRVVEKIIYVTIEFARTVKSEKYQEAIDAQDIKVEKDKIMKLTTTQLIELANARAWSTKDGTMLAIKDVNIWKVNDYYYRVKFATELGTTIEINVQEYQGQPLQLNNTIIHEAEQIYAINQSIRKNVLIVSLLIFFLPITFLGILTYLTTRQINIIKKSIYDDVKVEKSREIL